VGTKIRKDGLFFSEWFDSWGDGGEFQLDAVTAAVSSVYFVECIYFLHKK